MGCRATGQGCPQVLWVLSRQWGWHWDNPMGFTWGWQGLGDSWGHFAYVPAAGAGVPVLQFGEHARPPQDTSGSQQGPKTGGDSPLQPPSPSILMPGDRLVPGLDPVPPPARVWPGWGERG